MLTLSVRGLPRKMTEQLLTEMFTAHGRVRNLKMSRDLFSGECRGFAELEDGGYGRRIALDDEIELAGRYRLRARACARAGR